MLEHSLQVEEYGAVRVGVFANSAWSMAGLSGRKMREFTDEMIQNRGGTSNRRRPSLSFISFPIAPVWGEPGAETRPLKHRCTDF
jgi:hypothetical protein